MKSFLKYTLATVTGIILANLVLFFFLSMLVGALTLMPGKTVTVRKGSVLLFRMDRNITDRAVETPFDDIDLALFRPHRNYGMNRILASIRHAAADSRIRGICLDFSDMMYEPGLAFAEELREALLDFRKSGKFIYSFSNTGYSQKNYYLATAADSIFLTPEATFLLNGLSSSIPYYRNALEKLGIRAEVVKVGKFKSAVEPFLTDTMSTANREQVGRYLSSSWESMVSAISASRHIPAGSIDSLADRSELLPNTALVDLGYFDGIIYRDGLRQKLADRCGCSTGRLHTVSLADYQQTLPLSPLADSSRIAVIYAEGEIGMQQGYRTVGPELCNSIRKARENDAVKAIVLRITSPGGSALTSDLIWRETVLAARTKPLIVSMGNVAASGGYYIACAADTIVAEPTTLTGSIGIYGLSFSGEELIRERLGISTSTVNTNRHSDFGGSYPLFLPLSSRPMTDYERQVMQAHVNRGYETFLNRVMTGRGMTRDEVHAIAQGRVWTGRDALGIGLVDVLGGLDKAVSIAAAKAGLERYSILEYPLWENPWAAWMSDFSEGIRARILDRETGGLHTVWKRIGETVSAQGILARLPLDIEVK